MPYPCTSGGSGIWRAPTELFVTAVHVDTSKGINTLLTQNRYDAPGEIFDARKPHYMRLMDAEAQAARLTHCQ